MANHPNRSRASGERPANPAPEAIRAARIGAGLTQAQAGVLVHASLRAWEDWEGGQRRMHPGLWELFGLKLAERAAT